MSIINAEYLIKNDSGEYDKYHYQTNEDMVMTHSGEPLTKVLGSVQDNIKILSSGEFDTSTKVISSEISQNFLVCSGSNLTRDAITTDPVNIQSLEVFDLNLEIEVYGYDNNNGGILVSFITQENYSLATFDISLKNRIKITGLCDDTIELPFNPIKEVQYGDTIRLRLLYNRNTSTMVVYVNDQSPIEISDVKSLKFMFPLKEPEKQIPSNVLTFTYFTYSKKMSNEDVESYLNILKHPDILDKIYVADKPYDIATVSKNIICETGKTLDDVMKDLFSQTSVEFNRENGEDVAIDNGLSFKCMGLKLIGKTIIKKSKKGLNNWQEIPINENKDIDTYDYNIGSVTASISNNGRLYNFTNKDGMVLNLNSVDNIYDNVKLLKNNSLLVYKKTIPVVISELSNIGTSSQQSTNDELISYEIVLSNVVTPNVGICDTFDILTDNLLEGINVCDNKIILNIQKRRLTTCNMDGIKQWLTNNNINMILVLNEPLIDIIPNINPIQTYNGPNTIKLESEVKSEYSISLPMVRTADTSKNNIIYDFENLANINVNCQLTVKKVDNIVTETIRDMNFRKLAERVTEMKVDDTITENEKWFNPDNGSVIKHVEITTFIDENGDVRSGVTLHVK